MTLAVILATCAAAMASTPIAVRSALSSGLRAAGGPTDACSLFTTSCDSCTEHVGCGWCGWGQGACMTGALAGPTSSTCHSARSNWYYGAGGCTDECYLNCGITCGSSQTCDITRDPVTNTPSCSCQTKTGIIIASVLGSLFCCCCFASIFVYVRRKNALAFAAKNRQLNFSFDSHAPSHLSSPDPTKYRPAPSSSSSSAAGYAPPTYHVADA